LKQQILVNTGLGETRIAIVEDEVCREVLIERPNRRSVVGAIYLGHVASVVPAMNAAFVDVGLARSGFLGARDARLPSEGRGDEPPIGESVTEGEAVLVQAVKDPLADKGVRLSCQISLAGRFLVFMPQGGGIAVSRRIDEEEKRQALIGTVTAAASTADADGGFIVRTAAADASADELAADIESLGRLWDEILDIQASSEAPACLFNDLGPVERTLRDHVSAQTEAIVIDDDEAFAAARAYCARELPGFADRLKRHPDSQNLFDEFSIEADISSARAPRVDLPSGGHIVIERTEALTAVDVNSGRATGRDGHEAAILTTNLDAAREIARQLRLRNIGGLVVVDFIHMPRAEDGEAVIETLREATVGDRAPMQLGGLSEFGLLEMTRKRTRDPLGESLSETCAECEGMGRTTTPETVAYEVLRRAQQEARSGDAQGGNVSIYVAGAVAEFLEGDAADLVAILEARLGSAVEIQLDNGLAGDEYDIEVG
jgi:ribonuclease G